MDKIFKVKRNNNEVVLYAYTKIDSLREGAIFFRRNEDSTIEILYGYEYLDEKYLDNIVETLIDDEEYDFSIVLEKKLY